MHFVSIALQIKIMHHDTIKQKIGDRKALKSEKDPKQRKHALESAKSQTIRDPPSANSKIERKVFK
jgi:hypothetical protein